MPLFDYVCPKCGHKFEKLVAKYDQEVVCPKCNNIANKSYSGSVLGSLGKKPSNCTGDCKNCSGCK